MKWYEKLYVGVSLLGKVDETCRSIEEDTCDHHLMIITLASNGVDQLDIRRASGWAGRCREREHPLDIIGIAADKPEAIDVVRTMIEECVKETGQADLRQYLYPS